MGECPPGGRVECKLCAGAFSPSVVLFRGADATPDVPAIGPVCVWCFEALQTEAQREIADAETLLARRRAQTEAARRAAAQARTPEERSEHMRKLALRSAQVRRQRRLDRLRAEAQSDSA